MDLARLKEIGVDFGYEGAELRQFISVQQEADRAERREEREVIRAREEHEAQAVSAREERDAVSGREEREAQAVSVREAQAVRVREGREAVSAREEREAAFRLEEMRFKHEESMHARNENADASLNISVPTHNDGTRTLKLPCFSQDRDDIDDYIMIFERYASAQGWQMDTYAVCLGAFLTGKALELYSRIPLTHAKDYDHLKNALLTRFQTTADDFRRQFITSRQNGAELPSQFLARLEHYLSRWISLFKVDESFDGLINVLLREQFVNPVPRDLSIYPREHAATDLNVVSDLACRFAMVRSSGGYREQPANRSRLAPVRASNEGRSNETRAPYSPPRCYTCGETGHMHNSCPRGGRRPGVNRERQDGRFQGGRGMRGNVEKSPRATFANAAIVEPCDEHVCSVDQKNVKLECGCNWPIVVGSCTNECTNLPMFDGFVNETPVRALHDTGCSAIVVKRSLVRPADMTGQLKLMVMIDRTMLRVPTAMCHIRSQIYTGIAEVLCLENPICDLIVGNVDGVCDDVPCVTAIDDELHEESCELDERGQSASPCPEELSPIPNETVGEMSTRLNVRVETANAVTTPAQKVKEARSREPLHVPVIDQSGISVADFRNKQKQDTSLHRLWELASVEKDDGETRKPTHRFRVDGHMLFRHQQCDDGEDVRRQLVVPHSLRHQVMKVGHETLLSGHQGGKNTLDRIRRNFLLARYVRQRETFLCIL